MLTLGHQMTLNIEDFFQYLLSVRKTKRTSLRLHRTNINSIIHFLDGTELTTDSFERYVTQCLSSAKDDREERRLHNTLNTRITTYNNLIEYFNYRDITHSLKKYSHFKKERGDIDPLSPEEMRALLNVKVPYGPYGKWTGEQLDHMYHVFTYFIMTTGARFNEARCVRVEDLNLLNGTVKFRETKNGKVRSAYLYEPVLGYLKDLCVGKKSNDLVFTNTMGSKIQQKNYRIDCLRRMELAGINRKVHPHLYRHSFATDLKERGAGIDDIAELLGHSSIQTTKEMYIHFNDRQRRRVAEKASLNLQGVKPIDIVKQMHEMIDSFHLEQDERFNYDYILKLKEMAYLSIKKQ